MLGRLVRQRIVLLVRAGIGLARHQPADISGERIALGQRAELDPPADLRADIDIGGGKAVPGDIIVPRRSEEHTSELQSLMRISYAVFCFKKKKTKHTKNKNYKPKTRYTHTR